MRYVQPNFAVLLEKFFCERLMKQQNVSQHTIRAYRDSFKLLLRFAHQHLKKTPSLLCLSDIDAPFIVTFLDYMEKERGISARSRNLRLTAIRSFFHYASFEEPGHAAQIQRVLAIPSKRFERAIINFLTREEIVALLDAPDQSKWAGRRDYVLLLLALHTGLRLSELLNLKTKDVTFGTGSHVRVFGKGRKERCTPLTKQTAAKLQSWIKENNFTHTGVLFPNLRNSPLSADGMQYILTKHTMVASRTCHSLIGKRVTPHCLRHTMAMELLQSGVDRSMIALWLGHESVETTQVYLHANLALKEKLLEKTSLPSGQPGLYRPDDELMRFLTSL